MKGILSRQRVVFFAVMMGLASAVALPAQAQVVALESRADDSLSLPIYKSGILELERVPSQISVGNPGIADILILRGRQVHVVAKALGSTNVVFWDGGGNIFATVDIEVTHDLKALKEKLFTLLPGENIGVHSVQEKLVLKGSVSGTSRLKAAVDIAEGFLPECVDAVSAASGSEEKTTNTEACKKGEVVNLLTVGGAQQVMLEVKVAEMSREFLRSFDNDLGIINFADGGKLQGGAVNGGAQWPNVLVEGREVPFAATGFPDTTTNPIGMVVDKFDPTTPSIADTGLFFSQLVGDSYIQLAMELSRQKGLSKILAEPNLTTLSGRKAKFVSGGEFPLAVRDRDGVTLVYKEFGVIVEFTPTVVSQDQISLDLDIAVSDIQSANAVVSVDDYYVDFPIIDKRGASSTVELRNGQTIGIAGLIQDDVSESFSELPGLGQLPILGNLFRSQAFRSNQTELVIFVTPHIAKPIEPELIRLPTDSFVPPNDVEFYLMGKMASSRAPGTVVHGQRIDGGFDGVRFGHDL